MKSKGSHRRHQKSNRFRNRFRVSFVERAKSIWIANPQFALRKKREI